MKKLAIVLLALLVAGSAFAGKVDSNGTLKLNAPMEMNREATLTFDALAASGFVFSLYSEDDLAGNITGAFGDFVMNEAGVDWNYCDDFTVIVATLDLSEVILQVGGWDDTGAANRFGWPEGGSSDPGPGGGLVEFGLDIDVTGYYLFLGNGYASGGENTWTGTITLYGSIVDNDATSFGAVKALFN
jgi:hypothetical protein